MKVHLHPNQQIRDYQHLEEVPVQDIYGVIRRPEDPPIKSLLEWETPDTPPRDKRPKIQKGWVSESHEQFKAYYFESKKRSPERGTKGCTAQTPLDSSQPAAAGGQLQDDGKSTPLFDPQSINENLRETNTISSLSTRPKRQKKKGAQPTAKQQEKRQEEQLKKFRRETRWLPNSAFTTYYGKPAFCNYGNGNVNPTVGGIMYGEYLKSHSIVPHEQPNNPQFAQVYHVADMKGSRAKPRKPEAPRKVQEEDRLMPEEVEQLKQRNPIYAEQRAFPSKPIVVPKLKDMRRFKNEGEAQNKAKTQNQPKTKADASGVQQPQQSATAKPGVIPGPPPNFSQGVQSKSGGPIQEGQQNKYETVQFEGGQDNRQQFSSGVQNNARATPTPYDQTQVQAQTKSSLAPGPSQQPQNPSNTQSNSSPVPGPPQNLSYTQSQNIQGSQQYIQQEQFANAGRPNDHRQSAQQTSQLANSQLQADQLAQSNFQDVKMPPQTTTTYRAMTSNVKASPPTLLPHPHLYCNTCVSQIQPNIEQLDRPNALNEIPAEDINPKTYKFANPQ